MNTILKKLEELFRDVGFAEAGELDPPSETRGALAAKMEDVFTAVAFAEEGEFEEAVCLIDKDRKGCRPLAHGKTQPYLSGSAPAGC